MPDFLDEQQFLPQFRQDLELFRGPDEADGSPTYNLLDPVTAKYYKIKWGEALILNYLRPKMTLDELCKEIETHTTLKVSPDEIKQFFAEAFRHHLLALPTPSDLLLKESEQAQVGYIKWILLHYLYIRFPLINPDDFLTRTLPLVKPFSSRVAFLIYFILGALGIFLLLDRFDEFLNTFTYFFNFEGLLVYALAIIFVKIIHEFAHAYTAKAYGVHIPTMGVLLMVLWPVLYTDITDSWKLSNRRQRFAIAFAGIAAELTLASLATLGWAFTEPGLLQSVFFIIASATWITTLAININPAMRFDGYYLLSDLWGVDNLQPRAFAVTRWKLREWLLGFRAPPPEEGLSPKLMRGMIIYSLYTWIYRLFLYTTIAIFIYYKFTKVLGVFLFFVEILLFILWPIAWELQELKRLRQYFNKNPQILLTILVLAFIAFWLIFPLPHKETFPAVTAPLEAQVVYVPEAGIIKEIYIQRGDTVKAGQLLISIVSKQLESKIGELEVDKQILQKSLHILSLTETDRPYMSEKKEELASVEEQIKGFLDQKQVLNIKASISGKVFLWDENLRIGQAVKKDEVLGKIADTNSLKIIFFVPEAYIHTISLNQPVMFRLKTTLHTAYGVVTKIDPLRVSHLQYPVLASINQGDIPVTEEKNNIVLTESYFPVTVTVEKIDFPSLYGQTGIVLLDGPWESKFLHYWRYAVSLFWQESGV